MTGLAHIGIMVKDIDVSKEFYVDKLGFILTDEVNMDNGVRLAFLNVGTCLLELVQTPDHSPRGAGAVDHVAIEVEDIETLVCKLVEKQINFLTNEIAEVPILGGIKNIFFTGPDGERLEFFEYLKK